MHVRLDHLAVAARTLEEGVAHVERLLGVLLAPGGRHAAMGTHNRLLSLGPDVYLEVIAIDPAATPPDRPRWFGLDSFDGTPRLTNWVARTRDLDAALALAPGGAGRPMPLSRGDLRWKMAVPDDGVLPFDGAFPALIEWQGDAHPAPRLPDRGCRLAALEIGHPRAADLSAALARLGRMNTVAVAPGPEKRLAAIIETPLGRRRLT